MIIVISFLSGQITQSESIFTYAPGKSARDYSNPNHVPPFMDEIRSSLEENGTFVEICQNNTQCLFDANQTGDVDVAMDTLQFEEQAKEQVIALGI